MNSTFDIIPAVDIIGGQCVRLSKGDYDTKKTYYADPLDAAKAFEDAGIRRLHLVDLDGAKAGGIVNAAVLERISTRTKLVIDFGGGLKRDEDIRRAFECGASYITAGSIAVKDPEKVASWIETYGKERIILGADVKDRMVALSGWLEASRLTAVELILRYTPLGLRTVISTEISKDGMLNGPSYELYEDILSELAKEGIEDLQLIASGGVSCVEDVLRLKKTNVSGVIIGKAFYEGRISLEDLKRLQA